MGKQKRKPISEMTPEERQELSHKRISYGLIGVLIVMIILLAATILAHFA